MISSKHVLSETHDFSLRQKEKIKDKKDAEELKKFRMMIHKHIEAEEISPTIYDLIAMFNILKDSNNYLTESVLIEKYKNDPKVIADAQEVVELLKGLNVIEIDGEEGYRCIELKKGVRESSEKVLSIIRDLGNDLDVPSIRALRLAAGKITNILYGVPSDWDTSSLENCVRLAVARATRSLLDEQEHNALLISLDIQYMEEAPLNTPMEEMGFDSLGGMYLNTELQVTVPQYEFWVGDFQSGSTLGEIIENIRRRINKSSSVSYNGENEALVKKIYARNYNALWSESNTLFKNVKSRNKTGIQRRLDAISSIERRLIHLNEIGVQENIIKTKGGNELLRNCILALIRVSAGDEFGKKDSSVKCRIAALHVLQVTFQDDRCCELFSTKKKWQGLFRNCCETLLVVFIGNRKKKRDSNPDVRLEASEILRGILKVKVYQKAFLESKAGQTFIKRVLRGLLKPISEKSHANRDPSLHVRVSAIYSLYSVFSTQLLQKIFVEDPSTKKLFQKIARKLIKAVCAKGYSLEYYDGGIRSYSLKAIYTLIAPESFRKFLFTGSEGEKLLEDLVEVAVGVLIGFKEVKKDLKGRTRMYAAWCIYRILTSEIANRKLKVLCVYGLKCALLGDKKNGKSADKKEEVQEYAIRLLMRFYRKKDTTMQNECMDILFEVISSSKFNGIRELAMIFAVRFKDTDSKLKGLLMKFLDDEGSASDSDKKMATSLLGRCAIDPKSKKEIKEKLLSLIKEHRIHCSIILDHRATTHFSVLQRWIGAAHGLMDMDTKEGSLMVMELLKSEEKYNRVQVGIKLNPGRQTEGKRWIAEGNMINDIYAIAEHIMIGQESPEMLVSVNFDTWHGRFKNEARFLSLAVFIAFRNLKKMPMIKRVVDRDPDASYGPLIRGDVVGGSTGINHRSRRLDIHLPYKAMIKEGYVAEIKVIKNLAEGMLYHIIFEVFKNDSGGEKHPEMGTYEIAMMRVYRHFKLHLVRIFRDYNEKSSEDNLAEIEDKEAKEEMLRVVRGGMLLEESLYPYIKWVGDLYAPDSTWNTLYEYLLRVQYQLLQQRNIYKGHKTTIAKSFRNKIDKLLVKSSERIESIRLFDGKRSRVPHLEGDPLLDDAGGKHKKYVESYIEKCTKSSSLVEISGMKWQWAAFYKKVYAEKETLPTGKPIEIPEPQRLPKIAPWEKQDDPIGPKREEPKQPEKQPKEEPVPDPDTTPKKTPETEPEKKPEENPEENPETDPKEDPKPVPGPGDVPESEPDNVPEPEDVPTPEEEPEPVGVSFLKKGDSSAVTEVELFAMKKRISELMLEYIKGEGSHVNPDASPMEIMRQADIMFKLQAVCDRFLVELKKQTDTLLHWIEKQKVDVIPLSHGNELSAGDLIAIKISDSCKYIVGESRFKEHFPKEVHRSEFLVGVLSESGVQPLENVVVFFTDNKGQLIFPRRIPLDKDCLPGFYRIIAKAKHSSPISKNIKSKADRNLLFRSALYLGILSLIACFLRIWPCNSSISNKPSLLFSHFLLRASSLFINSSVRVVRTIIFF